MTALSAYSWYEDDELLALMDRYIGRAADAPGAGRRLKIWLARSETPATPISPLPVAEGVSLGEPDANGRVWLTRPQAAARMGISAKTLANYGNDGPPYEPWPFVRYRLDLLDDWIAQRKRSARKRGRPTGAKPPAPAPALTATANARVV